MIRIGVVGTCQAAGIGDALLHLVDGCELSTFVIQDVYKEQMLPYAEKALAECDIVFSHHLHDGFGSLGTRTLEREIETLVLIPPVVFTGFHPDCINLIRGDTSHLSPLGSYHSAIVAAAYSLGIPADRVARLFNKMVFQKLGYFDEFAKARIFLNRSMRSFGFDIAGEWSDWLASGSFMHSFNHPKPRVLASLAKLLAMKAGLIPAGTPTPEISFDFLSFFSIWPVYPELAETLGVKGSYVFKKNGGPDLIRGDHTLMSLTEFIQGSYDFYADIPAEIFTLPAVIRVRAARSSFLFEKAW